MSHQHKFGKNKEYDIRDVKMNKGAYQTKYGYIEQGQSLILLSNQDFIEYDNIVKKLQDNKKNDPHPKFNLKTKIPTNLTKIQKQYEQKMLKRAQLGPRTEISVDKNPSQIYDGTFGQCFNCVDKNYEILDLKNLNKKYREEYFKMREQRDQSAMLGQRHAIKVQQLLNQNLQLHKRVLMIQEQCKRLRNTHKGQGSKEKKLPSLQYLDQVMQRHKELYANITKLQSENHLLRNSNISKDQEIKELKQSNIRNPNPQNHMNLSVFKKNKNQSESFIALDFLNDSQEVQICD